MKMILKTLYALATLAVIGFGAWAIGAAGTPGMDWTPAAGYAVLAFVAYLVFRALYWFARRD